MFLASLSHPARTTIFSIRFLVVSRSESRGGFFDTSFRNFLWCVAACSRLLTHWHDGVKQTPADPESSTASSGLTSPCSSLARVILAVLGTIRALLRVTAEPSVERRVLFERMWGTDSAFPSRPLHLSVFPKDLFGCCAALQRPTLTRHCCD